MLAKSDVYRCSSCRDTGWKVLEKEGVPQAVRCPDCHGRKRQEARLRAAQIPPRYLERGFDVYSVHHPLQEKALRRSIEYVESFPQVPRGLLFVGPCGVGKTHLAVAILKTLVGERGIDARFVDETEILRRLQYSYGPDSLETEREVLLPLMKLDLLVWDDLGTGRPTEWVAETIRTVLNHRYTYNKQTILTTNWSLSSSQAASARQPTLAERIGHRLYSRLMEMCEVVEVDGPDARTEIHKARLDFESQRRLSCPPPEQQPLSCPYCSAGDVWKRDYSKPKKSQGRPCVEIACLCRACGEHFVARHYQDSGEVEYPHPA